MEFFRNSFIVTLLLFFCKYKEIIAHSGSINKLSIISFDEGYSHLFGDENVIVLKDGKSVLFSLDERIGSGFMSQDLYLHRFFSASIKLPADYTAGVVVVFYVVAAMEASSNEEEGCLGYPSHDESVASFRYTSPVLIHSLHNDY
ncbi:probable xyloglucan endotransglucosylase/hydrolase protein 28 [Amaranthus tricolor]|uniref:probable xyloglucan endotransglucosylase/hydrolase protein 28 n=1 Tax=Amaranthus tricolor TaxID=29722 RepID=UPI00258BF822|nr:probable xyloglucan endotransglucosylase/hydrolase protein 28 [Amaranthus tricolor]